MRPTVCLQNVLTLLFMMLMITACAATRLPRDLPDPVTAAQPICPRPLPAAWQVMPPPPEAPPPRETTTAEELDRAARVEVQARDLWDALWLAVNWQCGEGPSAKLLADGGQLPPRLPEIREGGDLARAADNLPPDPATAPAVAPDALVWALEVHFWSGDWSVWRVGPDAIRQDFALSEFESVGDCMNRGSEIGRLEAAKLRALRDIDPAPSYKIYCDRFLQSELGDKSPFWRRWSGLIAAIAPESYGVPI